MLARPAPARRCRGFTLLEILIALALAASMLAIVVPHIGGATAPSVQRELDRVRALVALGSEQAIVHGADLGVGFTPDGYRFFQRVQRSWVPLREPRAYRDYRFAPGMSLQLRVEGDVVDIASEVQAPQVVLWSSGELTPFELSVASAGRRQRLIAHADGALSMRPGAPEMAN